MYRDARERVGISRDEAAFKLHIGTRTLAYYEAQERLPGPDVVLEMCREYNQPDLTIRYCRECCPIGQVYSYDSLNNIDMSLPAVILKLISELKEAMSAVDVLLELTVNKRTKADFTEAEWSQFIGAVQEFLDVEHNIEVLKIAIEGLTAEQTLVPKLIAQHNQKCRDHGYIKEKRPLQAAY